MCEDVFQHHDGVVDNHADAHGDAAQAHHVERDVEHLHEQENRDDAHRHGNGDDKGGAAVAQEEEQHHGGQQHAQHDVLHGIVHREVDVIPLIHNGGDRNGRIVGRKLINGLFGRAGDRDGIDVGLLVDGEQHAGLPVDLGDVGDLFLGHRDVGNLVKAHAAARGQGDERAADVLDSEIARVRTESVPEPFCTVPAGIMTLSDARMPEM